MFATVVMQSYIFIPTTHIYFLEFSSPNSASGGAAWPPADVRSVGRSGFLPPPYAVIASHCLFCTGPSWIRVPPPLPLLWTIAPPTPPVAHPHCPWQAIAPLPKNPSIVVLAGQTFGDFVYINGRVVLKSVLQLYMDLLWMWIFWSLNYYCNNDNNYCHFCWWLPFDAVDEDAIFFSFCCLLFWNTPEFIFFGWATGDRNT